MNKITVHSESVAPDSDHQHYIWEENKLRRCIVNFCGKRNPVNCVGMPCKLVIKIKANV